MPTDTRLEATLDSLVARGVLDDAQATAIRTELAARPEGLRGRLGEIAGYLGASLVLGATVLLLGDRWDELGLAGRVIALAAVAVVLAACGVALSRRRGHDVHRRLASTLLTGAAVTAGAAAGVGLDDGLAWSGTVLLGAIAGYLLARSALGLLAAAAAACGVWAAVIDDLDAPYGIGLIVLGVGFAALSRTPWIAERRVAVAIAVTLGLTGAQLVLFSTNAVSYGLTALVTAACFTGYARGRDWITLAGGVAGATLVVPEFLYDVTGGSLGAGGAMLVAGLTLLAGGLIGLRLRNEPPATA
ncbi:DUF2157 domain-containing protein [Symbioplanes lichenis]|uniref:DUF2157 domain-containing protein n=1 Tax=Symbioplanes lichenis TaxID=1629072 RepID=UPI002738FBA6|nr:DUF2157 domain-containing protein [Actinoplanes lichenis]